MPASAPARWDQGTPACFRRTDTTSEAACSPQGRARQLPSPTRRRDGQCPSCRRCRRSRTSWVSSGRAGNWPNPHVQGGRYHCVGRLNGASRACKFGPPSTPAGDERGLTSPTAYRTTQSSNRGREPRVNWVGIFKHSANQCHGLPQRKAPPRWPLAG